MLLIILENKPFKLAQNSPSMDREDFGIDKAVKLGQNHPRQRHLAEERIRRVLGFRGHAEGVFTTDVRTPRGMSC